jgi:Protein of unknown function (DUF2726)
MDRRKRILVNQYEEATHAALRDAASRSGARVFPKVRIADALDIESSGLDRDEYSYALKAHFDFVVDPGDGPVAFAVEFDGSKHDRDAVTIARDGLKNSICERLGMPLLRIDAGYLRKVGRFTLIGWLAEVWFLNAAFEAAQERGEIPWDEIFHYSFILGMGYFDDDAKFVEVDAANPALSIEELKRRRLVLTRPYDPFISTRARIQTWWRSGLVSNPTPEVVRAIEPEGHAVAIALLPLPTGGSIVGTGRCRPYHFPPVPPIELAEEMAILDVAEKFRRYQRGQYALPTPLDVEILRKRIEGWSPYRVR